MSTRDMYDKNMLKAFQSIARSLDRIADSIEKKNNKKSVNPSAIENSWKTRGNGNDAYDL